MVTIGSSVNDKQRPSTEFAHPTLLYRATNVKVTLNGTEQEATNSPSLWRKFQRKISQDHSKVPVAYVKPSRRYSLEFPPLEDDEGEEPDKYLQKNIKPILRKNLSLEDTSSLTKWDDNLSEEKEFNESMKLNVDSSSQATTYVDNDARKKVRRREGKASLHDGTDDQTYSEILEQIRKAEKDENGKDKKEEKKSRSRARKSKNTKLEYQRSMSAFAAIDLDNLEMYDENVEEEKQEKKKEKSGKGLSLKKQIVRRMSQSSLNFTNFTDDGILRPGEVDNVDNPTTKSMERKELKSERASSIEKRGTHVQSKDMKNGGDSQRWRRHSLELPKSNNQIEFTEETSDPKLQDQATFIVGSDEDTPMRSEQIARERESVLSDLQRSDHLAIAFGSQPDISIKLSTPSSPGKIRRNGTVTKSFSHPSRQETKEDTRSSPVGLIPPPLTLTGSRSLNGLNEEAAMDAENISPRRKVAGTWDFDEFQPDEEEKKKKKWSSKLGGFARRFGGSASILQHAITHSDAEGLQKQLLDASNRAEINNTKTNGVTVFHQACVLGDLKIIQMLLSNGADVNLKTWTKLSPVQIAVAFGHFDVAKLLVERGADQIDIINGFQMEALQNN